MTQIEYIEENAALMQQMRDLKAMYEFNAECIDRRHEEIAANERERWLNEKRRAKAEYRESVGELSRRQTELRLERAKTRAEEENKGSSTDDYMFERVEEEGARLLRN